jgi:hypothetical protein
MNYHVFVAGILLLLLIGPEINQDPREMNSVGSDEIPASADFGAFNCKFIFDVVVGWDAAWVMCEKRRLVKVDPKSNRILSEIRIEAWPKWRQPFFGYAGLSGYTGHLALQKDALWVSAGAALYRVDPDTNQIVQTIWADALDETDKPVGTFGPLIVSNDFVWVTATGKGDYQILKIDPKDERVVTRHSGESSLPILSIVSGAGSAWILLSPGVVRIESASGEKLKTIKIDPILHSGPKSRLLFGAGSIWYLTTTSAFHDHETLYWDDWAILRIDPGSNRVVATIPLPLFSTPVGLFFGSDFLWVLRPNNSLVRINPVEYQIDEFKENLFYGYYDGMKLKRIRSAGVIPDGVTWIDHFGPIQTENLVPAPDSRFPTRRPLLNPLLPAPPFPQDFLERTPDNFWKASEYHLSGERTHVEILTPPVLHSLHNYQSATGGVRGKKGALKYAPGRGFLNWNRLGEGSEAVVVIQVIPDNIEKRKEWDFAYGIPAFTGYHVLEPSIKKVFLLANGEEIPPFESTLLCNNLFRLELISEDGQIMWNDKVAGCYVSNTYPPEIFSLRAQFELGAIMEGISEPEIFSIPDETLWRIRSDLSPYFESVQH